MGAEKRTGEGVERVPRLAADFDPSQLRLSPAEGYLLSRIDGSTPWALLCEIGGLPAAAADRCLEAWLSDGLIRVDAEEAPPTPEGAAPAASHSPALPPAKIDATLDIAVEIQREILAFEKKLSQPYHEILGVSIEAGNAQIKKAYFGLSKKFHPDRYFRRNLGPFETRVEMIFKKVLEAYELLSDPAARAELQKSASATPPQESAGGGPKPRPGRSRPKMAERLSLLAQHRRHLEERKRRAKQLFESGIAAFRAERWLEAARGVRLAIAFDPRNEAFRDSFAGVQRKAHEEQAKLLSKQADDAFDLHDWNDAERLFEEALHYRPFDGRLSAQVARLAWQSSGDLRKAKDFAATACEMEPDNPSYRLLLGRIYKAAGLKANARRELETALRLDPMAREAKAELKSL